MSRLGRGTSALLLAAALAARAPHPAALAQSGRAATPVEVCQAADWDISVEAAQAKPARLPPASDTKH